MLFGIHYGKRHNPPLFMGSVLFLTQGVMSAPLLTIPPLSDMTDMIMGHAPIATPTLNNASPTFGDTIMVSNGFSDEDGDSQSLEHTIYQWQIAPSPDGPFSNIADVTGERYTVKSTDSGKFIRAGVRPGTSPELSIPYLGEFAYSPPSRSDAFPGCGRVNIDCHTG